MNQVFGHLVNWFETIPNPILFRLPTLVSYSLFLSILIWIIYGLVEGKWEIKNKKIVLLIPIFLFALISRSLVPIIDGAGGGSELRYITVGRELGETGRFTFIFDNQEFLYWKPYFAYPMLLSLLSSFFEITRNLGVNLNILLGSLNVLGVYFLAKEFFLDKKPALIAATLISFLPTGLLLSSSSESTITSMFFLLTFLTVFLKYLKKDDFYWGLGTTFLLAAVFISRTSNFIFLPGIILTLLVYKREDILNREYLVYAFILAILSILPFIMGLRMKMTFMPRDEVTFNMKRIFRRLSRFGHLIFAGKNFFLAVPQQVLRLLFLFGGVGIFYAFKKYNWKKNLAFSLPFVSYVGLFLSFKDLNFKYLHFPLVYLSIWTAGLVSGSYKWLKTKIKKFNGLKDYKNPKTVLIVSYVVIIGFSAFWSVKEVESLPPALEYPAAKEMVGRAKNYHPNCLVLPEYDVRPIRLAGYEAINPWAYGERRLGNLSWYKKEFNTSCLLYYKVKSNETYRYMEKFEKKANLELLFWKNYNPSRLIWYSPYEMGTNHSVYFVNLTD